MNILITGGTGFIGRTLCQQLLASQHNLIVLTRKPARASELIHSEHIRFISNLDTLADDREIDAIINLAGEPILFKRWTNQRKKTLEESRVGITNQLVQLIRRLKQRPHTLISASAVGYYGNRLDHKLSEEAQPNDEYSHRLCAAWETSALRAKAYDVRVCIIRIGVVIGKNGGFMEGMLRPFRLGLGAQIGNGQQWMSWIHQDDLRNIITTLLEQTEYNGIYNATAPLPVTNQYFSRMLGKILRRPVLFKVPAFVLEKALGENAQILLGGQRAIPKALESQGFKFIYPNIESALRDVI